jgi:hypothetical protein
LTIWRRKPKDGQRQFTTQYCAATTNERRSRAVASPEWRSCRGKHGGTKGMRYDVGKRENVLPGGVSKLKGWATPDDAGTCAIASLRSNVGSAGFRPWSVTCADAARGAWEGAKALRCEFCRQPWPSLCYCHLSHGLSGLQLPRLEVLAVRPAMGYWLNRNNDWLSSRISPMPIKIRRHRPSSDEVHKEGARGRRFTYDKCWHLSIVGGSWSAHRPRRSDHLHLLTSLQSYQRAKAVFALGCPFLPTCTLLLHCWLLYLSDPRADESADMFLWPQGHRAFSRPCATSLSKDAQLLSSRQ